MSDPIVVEIPRASLVAGGYMQAIEAVPEGGRWAIRHGSGYLGYVQTEADALALVRALTQSRHSSSLSEVIGSTNGEGGAMPLAA